MAALNYTDWKKLEKTSDSNFIVKPSLGQRFSPEDICSLLSDFGMDSHDSSGVWSTGRVHVIEEIPYSPKCYFCKYRYCLLVNKEIGSQRNPKLHSS